MVVVAFLCQIIQVSGNSEVSLAYNVQNISFYQRVYDWIADF
jgi:hypothetical protein